MDEIELKVNDFNEFTRFLKLFSILRQTCQMNVTAKGVEVFGKFSSGRCDLYSSSVEVFNTSETTPPNATIFLADISKFMYVLEMLGKYYNLSDNTPFDTQEIRIFVGSDSSYIRVASEKYTIKFQLSSNAVVKNSIGNESSYALKPSKYSELAHALVSGGREISELDFLLCFRTDAKRLANLSSLMSALSNADDLKIKMEIPEQTRLEQDLTAAGTSMSVIPNKLYSILSDNQKLVASKLGNKICVESGDIVKTSADYMDACRTDTTTENFIYLLTPDQLKLITSLVAAFFPKAKPAKKGKKATEQMEIPLDDGQSDGCVEIGVSKVNMMHMNLISQTERGCVSEFYVTLVGRTPE